MSTLPTGLPVPGQAAAWPVDALAVGAGISGTGAGYRRKARLPGTTFLILHARDRIGGTWDLSRYPGVRSDLDLHTFACQFKPSTRDNGPFWVNGQAVGFGEDGAEDGLVSAHDQFALAPSNLRRQVLRIWSPARRTRTDDSAGD